MGAMIAELRKLLSTDRHGRIEGYSATHNDTVYATPRDYMKNILNEQGIKAQVAMCFLDEKSLVLLVRSPQHLSYEATENLKAKLVERINKLGGCRIPKEIFWAFGAPNPQVNYNNA